MTGTRAIARIAAAAAAATLFAGQADAQRYYMHERIVGMPTTVSTPPATVYDGTWSTGSWSNSASCTGTSQPQSRTVSCVGTSCDPSTKPASSQSAVCSTKAIVCGANMLEGGSFHSQTIILQIPAKATRALSLEWCEGVSGATGCQGNASTVFAIKGYLDQYVYAPYDAARWSATCAKP